MSDKKDGQTDYNPVNPVTKYASTAMDSQIEETDVLFKKQSEVALSLVKETQRPAKTRTALYNELTKNDKVMEEEDYYEFSNPVFRGIALGVDLIFTAVIVKAAILASPIEGKLLHALFLDKYKLQFMFGEEAMLKMITVLSVFFVLFFLIVIPVAFFNVSLGKKLTKLRVRGDGKYSLSIAQAFQRELIYKPIGMACLAGFILPFFDKKKKSLHDKMTRTFVIKE
ncbi:MAG: RDD family protein [Rhizobacter sp.]|nr:RDD family protein [Bacteriovorax sp.]